MEKSGGLAEKNLGGWCSLRASAGPLDGPVVGLKLCDKQDVLSCFSSMTVHLMTSLYPLFSWFSAADLKPEKET